MNINILYTFHNQDHKKFTINDSKDLKMTGQSESFMTCYKYNKDDHRKKDYLETSRQLTI